jgi:pimeloyl-ACP methyl ester carboxylesterase
MTKKIVFLPFFLMVLICSAQTGQYIKATNTGCKIWVDDYSPTESVKWSGPCSKGYAAGWGIATWYRDGQKTATYTGGMKGGKINGKGKLVITDYATFQGNFIDGALNGFGAAYFVSGGKTVGNFTNGVFLNLDGKYLKLLQKQNVSLRDSTGIYGNDDNSTDLFYYLLKPRQAVKATLVLFPSTGETAENVISCNRTLMQLAYDKNIATVVVSANYNKSLESDSQAMLFFENVFAELVGKYNLPRNKFVLCGLSLGGGNALQYTEMSRDSEYDTYLKPMAVIGVDPAVDMTDLYNNAIQQIAEYEKEGDTLPESKKAALNENRFLIDYFHKLYGGPPEQYHQKYIEGSQFSRNQDDGGNAKHLIHVPVRLYCDPDILWQLKYKGRDYYHMNAANLSAMVNFLIKRGNRQAELIPAIGKGFRVDGTRHPHSWSIVDAPDCVNWIIRLAK